MPLQKLTILLFSLILSMHPLAQTPNLLCLPGEDTIFMLQLENKNWVSVCREVNGKYLVCRVASSNKIEMQVPAILDTNSWKRFTFSGYNRGGGKENAAMRFGYLSFMEKEVIYEVFELWNSEDDIEHCGMTVMKNNKFINNFIGNLESKKGNLVQLLTEPRVKQVDD